MSNVDLNYYNRVEGWFDWADIYQTMVEKAPQEAIFVELGVSLGKSAIFMASRIAQSGKNIKFFGVDCWDLPLVIRDGMVHLAPEGQCDINYHPETNFDIFMNHVKAAGVEKYITPIKMTTVDAAREFTNESLNFVFFDASHAYEPVLADIKAWYPKVIKGGWVAGHDYEPTETPGPISGGLGPWNVSRAVHEFFGGRGRITHICNSWMTRKP